MSIFNSLGMQRQQPRQNPMQQLQELKQNPGIVLQRAGFSIPDGMTDPTQITQHLISSGQVSQNRYTQIMQMMRRR